VHINCNGDGCGSDDIEVRHLTSREAKDLHKEVQDQVRGVLKDVASFRPARKLRTTILSSQEKEEERRRKKKDKRRPQIESSFRSKIRVNGKLVHNSCKGADCSEENEIRDNSKPNVHSTIHYNCNGEGCSDENKVHSTVHYNCHGDGCSDENKIHYSCIGKGCKDNVKVRHLTSDEAKDLHENVKDHVRGVIDNALGGFFNPGFPFRQPFNRRTEQEEEKEKETEGEDEEKEKETREEENSRETTLVDKLEINASF